MIFSIYQLFYSPYTQLFCIGAVLCIANTPVLAQSPVTDTSAIDTVNINANAINLYNKLIQLRDQNRLSFLNTDSDIYYSYSYRCINLKDSTVIDSSYGTYVINYERGYFFPQKLMNFKGSGFTDFNYYYDSVKYSHKEMMSLRYVDVQELFTLYNLMDYGMDGQWKRILQRKEKIALKYLDDGHKEFTTQAKTKITRSFLFDTDYNIERIDFFAPTYLFKSNYKPATCSFYVTVHYAKGDERIADKIEESYIVNDAEMPYRVEMEIATTTEPVITLRQVKKGKFIRSMALTGCNFYWAYLNVQEGIQKGVVERISQVAGSVPE